MKRICLVALVLFISSTVVFGQKNSKKKTKSPSADTEVSTSDVVGGYESYAPETTTQTKAEVVQPARATVPVLAAKASPSKEGYLGGVELLDGVYVDENNSGNFAVPLAYIRQADVMWSKNVMEEIDLREKPNRPLCHPAARLITVLLTAVNNGELTAFENPIDGTDSVFRNILTKEEILKVAGGRTDTIQIPDPEDPYIMRDTVVTEMFNPEMIDRYRIKEVWFFDKQRSVFEPRIIGIAPCKLQISRTTGDTLGSTPMFWIYYPEARDVLVNAQMFNRFNDSSNMNFDDFFIKRMFSAYITKESNFDDLRIRDYAIGMDRLYESERIRRTLMNYEEDLWEY